MIELTNPFTLNAVLTPRGSEVGRTQLAELSWDLATSHPNFGKTLKVDHFNEFLS